MPLTGRRRELLTEQLRQSIRLHKAELVGMLLSAQQKTAELSLEAVPRPPEGGVLSHTRQRLWLPD